MVLGIMPWNFPYYQVARLAAPNVMLGNTVLLRRGTRPGRAGAGGALPRCRLPGGRRHAPPMLNQQIADIVIRTRLRRAFSHGLGARGFGRGRHRGKNLKKVVLELGGRTPSSCWMLRTWSAPSSRVSWTHAQQRPPTPAVHRAGRGVRRVRRASRRPSVTPETPSTRRPSWARCAPWMEARMTVGGEGPGRRRQGARVTAGGKSWTSPVPTMEATVLADVAVRLRRGDLAPWPSSTRSRTRTRPWSSPSSRRSRRRFRVRRGDRAGGRAARELRMVYVDEVTGTAPGPALRRRQALRRPAVNSAASRKFANES
ncbi:hypothetical protein QJS66_10260 [Kocuria rhizophila]|nr:hypothetical protein QJS66_10260 [Kocuria rhizophila]